VGWYNENSGSAVHEVGKKLANELGIYDMSGNLREWSGSWYPGSEGSNRVIRGGNWYGIAGNCGVANRVYLNSEYRSYYNGFRVALSSVP
jgi:formylglycine-generating enzyme required for sulfatase activity